MRAALLLPLLLAGCLQGCGPTPHEVHWDDPEFAAALPAAGPDGWDVYTEPRPVGFAVEHPWLDDWNAGLRSISLQESLEVGGQEHRHTHVYVRLAPSGQVTLDLLADQDPDAARPMVLRFLEALTDGNESQRDAWADALLSAPDLPEDQQPAPEHRSFVMVPYRLDLPPERLRVQAFVDEHLGQGPPSDALRVGDWWLQVDYATTRAVRDGREFHASPGGNRFGDASWREGYGSEEAMEDFRAAYASLGLGAPPEDAEVQSVIC